MTLNQALDRLNKEFPGKYVAVYIDATDTSAIMGRLDRKIVWSIYVGNEISWRSDASPTLDEAIKSLKRKTGIDQPQQEDVEVIE